MADILGSVKITGFISPTDTEDTFATHDAIYGKGGLRSVDTINSRDNITPARRSEGMMVYVEANQKIYILKGGIENSNWEEFSGGVGDVLDGRIIIGDATDGTVQSQYTMPKLDGNPGTVLQTDGNGAVTFQNIVETLSLAIIEELNATSNYQIQSGDLNGDGYVNTADLLIFLSQFGSSVDSLAQEFRINTTSLAGTSITNSVSDVTNQMESSCYLLELPSTPADYAAYTPWAWQFNATTDQYRLYTTDSTQAAAAQRSKVVDITTPYISINKTAQTAVTVGFYLKTVANYPTTSNVETFDFIYQIDSTSNIEAGQAYIYANASNALSNLSLKPFNTSQINAQGQIEYPTGVLFSFYACANWDQGEVDVRIKNVKLTLA